MTKTLLTILAATTMLSTVAKAEVSKADLHAAIESGNSHVCRVLPGFEGVNQSSLYPQNECWLDVHRADKAGGSDFGVVWAKIAGKYYSVPLKDIQQAGGKAAAKELFSSIVGAQITAEQADSIVSAAETAVESMNAEIATVTKTITKIVTETVIDEVALNAAKAEIVALTGQVDVLNMIINSEHPAELVAEYNAGHTAGFAAGVASVPISEEASEAYSRGFNQGVLSRVSVEAELESRIVAANVVISGLEVDLANAIATRDATIGSLTTQLNSVIGERDTLQASIDSLNNDLRIAAEAIANGLNEIDARRAEIVVLEAAAVVDATTISGLNAQITSLSAQVVAEQARVVSIQASLTTANGTIEGLRSDVGTLNARINTLNIEAGQSASLVDQLTASTIELRGERDSLQTKIDVANRNVNDAESIANWDGVSNWTGQELHVKISDTIYALQDQIDLVSSLTSSQGRLVLDQASFASNLGLTPAATAAMINAGIDSLQAGQVAPDYAFATTADVASARTIAALSTVPTENSSAEINAVSADYTAFLNGRTPTNALFAEFITDARTQLTTAGISNISGTTDYTAHIDRTARVNAIIAGAHVPYENARSYTAAEAAELNSLGYQYYSTGAGAWQSIYVGGYYPISGPSVRFDNSAFEAHVSTKQGALHSAFGTTGTDANGGVAFYSGGTSNITDALAAALDATELNAIIGTAYDAGYESGYEDGYADGYADGFSDGFSAGRAS